LYSDVQCLRHFLTNSLNFKPCFGTVMTAVHCSTTCITKVSNDLEFYEHYMNKSF
jgi:hypothetical protein